MSWARPVLQQLRADYESKEKILGAEAMRYHERMVMLSVLDGLWKDHLLSMDHLKEGIGMRGYAQQDPLVAYKKESFEMFEAMMTRFQEDTARFLFRMQIVGPDGQPFTEAPALDRTVPPAPPVASAAQLPPPPPAREIPSPYAASHDHHRRSGEGVRAQEAARAERRAHGRSLGQQANRRSGAQAVKSAATIPAHCGSGKGRKHNGTD
jgi:preprotein translocase subunit SecA